MDENEGVLGSSLKGVIKAFGEGNPFMDAPKQLIQIMQFAPDVETGVRMVVGKEASNFVPTFLGEIAKAIDVDDDGDVIKRTPKGVWDEVLMKIPYYRNLVETAIGFKLQHKIDASAAKTYKDYVKIKKQNIQKWEDDKEQARKADKLDLFYLASGKTPPKEPEIEADWNKNRKIREKEKQGIKSTKAPSSFSGGFGSDGFGGGFGKGGF